jgi:hypothetical protein
MIFPGILMLLLGVPPMLARDSDLFFFGIFFLVVSA